MELIEKGFKDSNKLCERLNLLVATKQADKNNQRLDWEIAKILKQLKSNKCIPNCEHQKLWTNILKLYQYHYSLIPEKVKVNQKTLQLDSIYVYNYTFQKVMK